MRWSVFMAFTTLAVSSAAVLRRVPQRAAFWLFTCIFRNVANKPDICLNNSNTLPEVKGSIVLNANNSTRETRLTWRGGRRHDAGDVEGAAGAHVLRPQQAGPRLCGRRDTRRQEGQAGGRERRNETLIKPQEGEGRRRK